MKTNKVRRKRGIPQQPKKERKKEREWVIERKRERERERERKERERETYRGEKADMIRT